MTLSLDVEYVIPSDETHFVTPDFQNNAPNCNDPALIPQQGDVILFGPRSAWVVASRHFVWVNPDQLRIRVHVAHAPEQLAMHPTSAPTLVPRLPDQHD